MQYSLPIATATRQCFEQMKRWLDKCIAEHPKCSQDTVHKMTLPSRLLEVTKNEAGLSLKLVETKTISPSGVVYLTLSHCWGDKQTSVVLERGIYDQFLESILISQLSKCFQHAIFITSMLGYKLVWIDCLCIIQDSVEDKIREIPRMTQVYGQAELNLSASGFKNGESGLLYFFPRPRLRSTVAKLELSESTHYVVTIDHRSFDSSIDTGWRSFMKFSPLRKRGWVLQEQVLVCSSQAQI